MQEAKSTNIENISADDFGGRLKLAFGTPEIAEIARKLGTTYQQIKNYVEGRLPKAEVLLQIRESTNVDLDWLLTGEGMMYGNAQANLTKGLTSDSADEEEQELAVLFHDYKELQEEHREELRGLLKYVAHEVKRHREKQQRRGNEDSNLTTDQEGVESTSPH